MYVNGRPSLHINLRNVFIYCAKEPTSGPSTRTMAPTALLSIRLAGTYV